MGTATRKAAKAMALRTALATLALGSDAEASGARKGRKVLASVWLKRHGNMPGNFHAPDGRQVMTATATRPYRAK